MWFNVRLECWIVELFPPIAEWGFAVPALFRFAVLVPLFCRRVCLGAWAPIVHGVLVRQGGDVFALSAPSHLDWIGHWIGRRLSSSSLLLRLISIGSGAANIRDEEAWIGTHRLSEHMLFHSPPFSFKDWSIVIIWSHFF
jgi:hypothetical protein